MKEMDGTETSTELVGTRDWAILGTLVAPLLHELRNELNTIGLQTRILQRKLPPEQHTLLEVISRALDNGKELLEWIRLIREPLDKIVGVVDVSESIRGNLRRLSIENIPARLDMETRVHLNAPMSIPLKVQSPFEFHRLLSLLLRKALFQAAPRQFHLAIDLVATPAGAEIHFRKLHEPKAGLEVDQFSISGPFQPLAPLEEFQCDYIMNRIGVVSQGSLEDENDGLNLRIDEISGAWNASDSS